MEHQEGGRTTERVKWAGCNTFSSPSGFPKLCLTQIEVEAKFVTLSEGLASCTENTFNYYVINKNKREVGFLHLNW